jgi:aarF domain-containing kinase
MGLGMGRAMLAMQLFEKGKKLYADCEADPNPEEAYERTHRLMADECLKLAQSHGGIYNKAAQFVASLQGGAGDKGIPKAYIEALKVVTDKAPFKPFSEMDECFQEEFGGKSAKEVFASIDENPIAAASLAQVHRAVTKDGRHVAVKMQYPWLKQHLASDFAVFTMFGQQIKPGGFDLSWLVRDFQVSLTAELDFEGEAANAERCAEDLAHRPDVLVPDVVKEFSSKRVMTTQYVPDMTRCDNREGLIKAGYDPKRVGAALASVFAEMVFVHGHVHGDPHAGNVYVRPRKPLPNAKDTNAETNEKTEEAAASSSNVEPQIVLLDHGLYHDISDDLRADFCELVRASVNRDAFTARKMSIRFCGESGGLFRFFPLVLSPWFVFSSDVTAADLQAARKGALPPNTNLEDIGKFLVSLHDEGGTNMLGVLHSLGYTRGILNDLKFPEHLRLRAFAKFATLGVAVKGQNSKAVTSSGISSMVAFSLLLAQVRVEVLKWIIAVLTPVAPILAIAGKGSPGLAATMVSPAAHCLAALAVFIARLTEHPELMC